MNVLLLIRNDTVEWTVSVVVTAVAVAGVVLFCTHPHSPAGHRVLPESLMRRLALDSFDKCTCLFTNVPGDAAAAALPYCSLVSLLILLCGYYPWLL